MSPCRAAMRRSRFSRIWSAVWADSSLPGVFLCGRGGWGPKLSPSRRASSVRHASEVTCTFLRGFVMPAGISKAMREGMPDKRSRKRLCRRASLRDRCPMWPGRGNTGRRPPGATTSASQVRARTAPRPRCHQVRQHPSALTTAAGPAGCSPAQLQVMLGPAKGAAETVYRPVYAPRAPSWATETTAVTRATSRS